MGIATILKWAWVILSGAVTVILIPIAIYIARYYWDRRRWHTFEGLVRNWTRHEPAWGDLTDEDWHALAATRLSEAGFEPKRIKELIEVAVSFAKGCASQELKGSVQLGEKGVGDGEPKPSK